MNFKKDVVDMLIGYICETGVDPFLCIVEDHPDLQAPPGFSKAGVLILNVGVNAVHGYSTTDTCITYSAKFGGIPHQISVPYDAIASVAPRDDLENYISLPVNIPEASAVPESIEVPERNTKAHSGWAASAKVY